MVFWIAILSGVLFAWLAVRLGFYATWILLFNVLLSIYVAIFLAPLVVDFAPSSGRAASYGVAWHTGDGALRLVEQRKLSLDAPVNAYLTSWQVPENRFTDSQKVTLRRLLSHSAGLTVHGFPGYDVAGPVPTLVQVLDGAPPANTQYSDPVTLEATVAPASLGGHIVTGNVQFLIAGALRLPAFWALVHAARKAHPAQKGLDALCPDPAAFHGRAARAAHRRHRPRAHRVRDRHCGRRPSCRGRIRLGRARLRGPARVLCPPARHVQLRPGPVDQSRDAHGQVGFAGHDWRPGDSPGHRPAVHRFRVEHLPAQSVPS